MMKIELGMLYACLERMQHTGGRRRNKGMNYIVVLGLVSKLSFTKDIAMKALEKKIFTFTQGGRSITDFVMEFERLVKIFPNLVSTEKQKVDRMLGIFRPEITLAI